MARPPIVLLAVLAGCGGTTVAIDAGNGDSGVDVTASSACPPQTGACCGPSGSTSKPICERGEWGCPPGTAFAATCEGPLPPTTCTGEPFPGEVCTLTGWVCAPKPADFVACPSPMCGSCPRTPIGATAGCLCECAANGSYECTTMPSGCECRSDADCADAGPGYVPCVGGSCMVGDAGAGKCWNDVQCAAEKRCDGTFVCPCTADCVRAPSPGTCVLR